MLGFVRGVKRIILVQTLASVFVGTPVRQRPSTLENHQLRQNQPRPGMNWETAIIQNLLEMITGSGGMSLVQVQAARGQRLENAVTAAFGWKGAMRSIVDANVTHILTGIILFVFGTRPEVIKLSPVILELKKYPEKRDLFTLLPSYSTVCCSENLQKNIAY